MTPNQVQNAFAKAMAEIFGEDQRPAVIFLWISEGETGVHLTTNVFENAAVIDLLAQAIQKVNRTEPEISRYTPQLS